MIKIEELVVVINKNDENRLKNPLNVNYFPMQKSFKILPNISSTKTIPTNIPKWRVANRRSSAALSKSSASFFSSKFFK